MNKAIICMILATSITSNAATFLSHPPVRPLPALTTRPMEKGPWLFVDASRGKDSNDGSEKAPWKTINHAMPLLSPGDTLYLRGGVYHENVYCAVAGKADAPITIRSYPGERAIIDGGMPEFLESPDKAWVPLENGEYQSAKPYKNIRDVVGLFGDSNIGLQTYWHAMDMRATNEMSIPDPEQKIMCLPIYGGPGLWYDRETGYIHVRLAHTHLDVPGIPNYQGETDPRKLPLVISASDSTPLLVDLAMHVRFKDLVIRGGGWVTVQLRFGIDLDFDNVIVYGGSYSLRAISTGPLKMTNSALYGMLPPWASYGMNGLNTYNFRRTDPFLPGPEIKNLRNIARLPSHYLLVAEGFDESSIFAYPVNHDWEISYCEFADSFDGVQCSGPGIRFHHNWLDNIRSNAIELTSPSPTVSDDVYHYQNLLTSCLIGFSFHPLGGYGVGKRYVFRNIIDNRRGIYFSPPTKEEPHGIVRTTMPLLAHGYGGGAAEQLYLYQNTIISPKILRAYAHGFLSAPSTKGLRRVFNNVFVYLGEYPEADGVATRDIPPECDIQFDGNLHWCPTPGAKAATNFLDVTRQCAASVANKGWEANSLVTNPGFLKFAEAASATNDYRLQPASPTVGTGVVLPAELEDPLRPKDAAKPDIGALPAGSELLKVGIHGRIVAGMPQVPEDK